MPMEDALPFEMLPELERLDIADWVSVDCLRACGGRDCGWA